MAHGVAQVLFDLGCNIEDTTMTRLCGEFAMILIASPPAGVDAADVARALAALEGELGLYVTCRPLDGAATAHQSGPRYLVTVYGPEARGLVARITGVLADEGANITDVQTRVAAAGEVYVMLIEIELRPGGEAAGLEAALQAEGRLAQLQISLRLLEEEVL
jgi:glycine cleavage system transcriptional repressor